MLELGREVCGDYRIASKREWLVTNGIGGFAMGTIAGVLTRRYHGLLVASLNPPVDRVLLFSKAEERARYAGKSYDLSCNLWPDGEIAPDGFKFIERFRLQGTTPVWTFALSDALLEKRVWMQQGANTTCIAYQLLRASAPLHLRVRLLVNWRDYHGTTELSKPPINVRATSKGLRLELCTGATPLHFIASEGTFIPEGQWCANVLLAEEQYRGMDEILDAHFHCGDYQIELQPGESFTLVASVEEPPLLDGRAAFEAQQRHEKNLLEKVSGIDQSAPVRQLLLAADQFIVRRDYLDMATTRNVEGRTVIAGYPWFTDWGRDTMIALPGLTLVTGRAGIAARILRTFAQYADQGMLPNVYPDGRTNPEYNAVDAPLWFFEAIRAYYAETTDSDLLGELFPALKEIIEWYVRGTRFNIRMDPADGLIYAGQEGVQLTWMDAKVEDWVVTPRVGKPVEISALWYNALRIMALFAAEIGESASRYEEISELAFEGFQRFWNQEKDCCFDVLDGTEGHDGALRPNQLFAVSLPHSPLRPDQQKEIVDICARQLLTSFGLRSLSPEDPDYIGTYGGSRQKRDAAYHQGTVWAWLMGPFVTAHLRVYGDKSAARKFLLPLMGSIYEHGLGTISEIFDGDPPHQPRGCPAQAWSVAELLRAWDLTG